MTQYVVQIRNSDGWLKKIFIVTEKHPIPPDPPAGITQIIMTNTTSYMEIVIAYDQYTTQLVFSYDEGAGTISCTGPLVETWPIN